MLELGSAGVDLMDDVLNAEKVVSCQGVLDNFVRSQGDSLAIDLAVASLVYQVIDEFLGGWALNLIYLKLLKTLIMLPIGDEGLDCLEHVEGCLVDLHEDSSVELSQSQQLEDLSGLGG